MGQIFVGPQPQGAEFSDGGQAPVGVLVKVQVLTGGQGFMKGQEHNGARAPSAGSWALAVWTGLPF